jgi:hypothetical protein
MQRIVLLLSSMVAGVLLLASGMLPSITYGQTTTASFTDVAAGLSHTVALETMERYGSGATFMEEGDNTTPPS